MKSLRLSWVTALLLALSAATLSNAAQFDCGQPVSTGNAPKSADALIILKASVGVSTVCTEHACICDVNGNSVVQAGDALLVLRAAVGIGVTLDCHCRPEVQLFFGTNGRGTCGLVVVDVELAGVDSDVRRDSEGKLLCSGDPALEAGGCDFQFSLNEQGRLRAVVSGCTVPNTANIFGCTFETGDLTGLRSSVAGQCDCNQMLCDAKPSVCASEVANPGSCEVCDNLTDDDGNGLVDCEDPNCHIFEGCVPVTTSSTSTSTTIMAPTTTLPMP